MKAVVQRVKQASVRINNEVYSEIKSGILVLIAFTENDNIETIKWTANKLVNLRIFNDEEGKLNKSVQEINGDILIVSNFTVYGDTRKGFRPSFTASAPPDIAKNIYNDFINFIKNNYSLNIQTGQFGAMMDVSLINDGPVTLILEK